MQNASTPAQFDSLAIGPKLRSYLGLSAGSGSVPLSDDSASALTSFLMDYRRDDELLATGDAVDLLDELVTMDMPEAVLELASRYPREAFANDFRAQLAIAVSAMLSGDMTAAEAGFRAAQALIPEEPAPYVNLVQIFMQQQRLAEAETWCLAGLDAEPNNFGLWDLMGLILRERHAEYMPETLMALAEKRCSWAGLSLGANLVTTGDRYLKANLLERLYAQGERDPQFLVELTGAHGIAGDYGKIPPLVWQAEHMNTKGLPWQLHVHCAQAQLAMNQPEAALAQLAKAKADPQLPDGARDAIAELEAEAQDPQLKH